MISPSPSRLSSTSSTSSARFVSFFLSIVPLFLSFFFPAMHLPEHTGQHWSFCHAFNDPQQPSCCCLPSPAAFSSPFALIGYWMVSHLCFVQFYLYLTYVATRGTHCAYSCKLRSSNRRIRRNDRRDYLRTLFRWLPSCPQLSCSRRETRGVSRSASWKSIKVRKKPITTEQ